MTSKVKFEQMFAVRVHPDYDLSSDLWTTVYKILDRYEQEVYQSGQERQNENEDIVRLHNDGKLIDIRITEMTSSMYWYPKR